MPASTFYLGKWTNEEEPVRYDPGDLTTHAVVVGMTGSGKTGLLIALLEEAARQGLPAIIIDPKGDLTNLMLHFPEQKPEDFAPWIDPEAARRKGLAVETLAEQTAARWREGLAKWGLGAADLRGLAEAVDYTVYTPGSTSGRPVNLLSSFEAPADWDNHREAERERISSTVTALLGLVGVNDVDPLRSREHILLSNILESHWSQGQSLDLAGLISEVTSPPFDRLGAFPLERFFPEKDRFTLALLLNNFLAAPSFQTWLEGDALDAGRLLWRPDGRPRFSIFYLAHLSESERMFFVTLLLAAVEGWMRGQRGSSGLRALLAFDEIVGYLPPVANPPSRGVLLRLLKQARAFGLGLALATQNPVDINYKALSNAGTWFIGRLQTEQDKNRLLDGLQSLESGIDRPAFDRLIARLGPRLFLLHNVHQPGPRIFESRWVMNYLAGPLTRPQIRDLRPKVETAKPAVSTGSGRSSPSTDAGSTLSAAAADRQPAAERLPAANLQPAAVVRQGAAAPERQAAPGGTAAPGGMASTERPAAEKLPAAEKQPAGQSLVGPHPILPVGTAEFYLPVALTFNRALAASAPALRGPLEPLGLAYRPALLAEAEIRYLAQRYGLNEARWLACLVLKPEARPDWDGFARPPFDPATLSSTPEPGAQFLALPGEWATARTLGALQKDFLDWAHRSGTIYLQANEALKIYAGPDVPVEDFRRQVEAATRQGFQAAADKLAAGYDSKLEALRRRIERQQGTVERREAEVGQRKAEQVSTDFELLTSVFSKRKRSISTSLTKRRLSQQAQGELDAARQALKALQSEWQALRAERDQAIDRLRGEWQQRAARVGSLAVVPLKKDVHVVRFGIAWLPVYRVKNPDGVIEAMAY